MEAPNIVGDCAESLCRRLCLPCGNNIHIDLTCSWISSRLLKSVSNKCDSLVHISLFNHIWESHFGECFRNSDHRFKLTGSRCDSIRGVTDGSHLNVLLNEVALDGIGELGSDTLSRVRNILSKEFPGNGVRLQKFSLLSWFSFIAAVWDIWVERHDVIRESSIGCLRLLIENKVNQVESWEEGWWHLHIFNNRHAWIVFRLDWICSCQDCGSCIEGANDTSLGDGNSLLLHGLMKNNSGVIIHFVELINAANTSIR